MTNPPHPHSQHILDAISICSSLKKYIDALYCYFFNLLEIWSLLILSQSPPHHLILHILEQVFGNVQAIPLS